MGSKRHWQPVRSRLASTRLQLNGVGSPGLTPVFQQNINGLIHAASYVQEVVFVSVNELYGRIVFTSSEETGTTFTVSLPEIPGTAPAGADTQRSADEDSDASAAPRDRILGVDDEDMVRTTLEGILSRIWPPPGNWAYPLS